MNEVDPIEDLADVEKIYKNLIRYNNVREAHLFLIGCNVALRIGDLLNLTFAQVEEDMAKIREQKTKKNKVLTFNEVVYEQAALLKQWYKTQYIDEPVYLFQSTSKNISTIKPVSSSWVNRKLSEASEYLDYNVGTHSMRKTFCYHAYQNGTDIRNIQKILNHRSITETLLYIGITKRKIANIYHTQAIKVNL